MKEGIVFDVCKNYVIVMTNTGEFLKLEKKGTPMVGDIYKGKIYIKFPVRYTAAAAILIFLTSFAGLTVYAHQIVGVVDIKGSRDVHIYINRMGKIQKVEGLNNSNSLKNLSIKDAVDKIEKAVIHENKDNPSPVVVSSREIKSSNVDLKEIQKSIETVMTKGKDKNDGNVKRNNSQISESMQPGVDHKKENQYNKPKGYEKKDGKKISEPKNKESNSQKEIKDNNSENKSNDANSKKQDNKDNEKGNKDNHANGKEKHKEHTEK